MERSRGTRRGLRGARCIMATLFYRLSAVIFLLLIGLTLIWPVGGAVLLVFAAIMFGMGVMDLRQTHHAVKRNFPVLGNLRYLLELVRPELQQYFVESNL